MICLIRNFPAVGLIKDDLISSKLQIELVTLYFNISNSVNKSNFLVMLSHIRDTFGGLDDFQGNSL